MSPWFFLGQGAESVLIEVNWVPMVAQSGSGCAGDGTRYAKALSFVTAHQEGFTMRLLVALAASLSISHAFALNLADLSKKDAVGGLKEALARGAEQAVGELGRADGFLGNDKVRIPLPPAVEKAEGLMRKLGAGKYADQLSEAMNRAAEAAVVEARPLLVKAVKEMSIDDAKKILSGGDDAATQYFRSKTAEPLTVKFLPVVQRATKKVKVAEKYDEFAGKAAKMKLLDDKDAHIDQYVTAKALDGLYTMIAEQEKKIRQDPVGSGSALLQKVFGALR